ncbi:hypothetical protein [Peribacillus frigoritolerans]|uniref:hypothetical protein n=1 Tax=Peribacillus frigoritolerans TaxID=450367 RepID=UPI002E1BC99A|nr:hypothetical protein [Peribacillus frigoritolerans]MED3847983.1 hypothetical protein [Peribacillus frigoritolerans]
MKADAAGIGFHFFFEGRIIAILRYHLVVIACHDKIVLYTARFIEMNMEELT